MLGGTQSLHTNAFDEALALPTDRSARIARNTQLILAEETGIRHVVDPLGGSYYVEQLTASLVQAAEALIDEVEALGGMTRAIEAGMPKAQIEAAAARRQARLGPRRGGRGRGQQVPPGRGSIRSSCSTSTPPRCARRSSSASPRCARSATSGRCQAALEALTEGAAGDANLLELGVEAARARATLGEISSAMERVFGRWRAEVRTIAGVYGGAFKEDQAFMTIQREVEAFAEAEGRRPRLLVAKLGQDGHDRGAKVIATAFADIGFDVDIGALFQTPEEAAREAIENDVHVVGVSTLAAGHKVLVPELIQALRAAGRRGHSGGRRRRRPARGPRVAASEAGVSRDLPARHQHPRSRARDPRAAPRARQQPRNAPLRSGSAARLTSASCS